jgi:outer membrane receptor for monomeric catechols
LSYVHLQENDTPDYGLPWFNNTVAPGPIRHSYYGFPDENYLQTNDDIVTLRVEHEFSPSVNLHTIARAANYPRQAGDHRIADLLERSDECAGGWSGGVAADIGSKYCPALSLYGFE